MLAARGEVEQACDVLEQALAHHTGSPVPFELGRTLLVHGRTLRRLKQKRAARESLERAAALRTAYTKVAAAEPALLATAPTSLKPDLRPVFGFINNLIADFKQVNWKISNMTSQLPTLAVQARRVSPHIRVVRAYLNTTCKLDV
jgi:hypothetical protein